MALLVQDHGPLPARDLTDKKGGLAGCRLSGTKKLLQQLPSPLCPQTLSPEKGCGGESYDPTDGEGCLGDKLGCYKKSKAAARRKPMLNGQKA